MGITLTPIAGDPFVDALPGTGATPAGPKPSMVRPGEPAPASIETPGSGGYPGIGSPPIAAPGATQALDPGVPVPKPRPSAPGGLTFTPIEGDPFAPPPSALVEGAKGFAHGVVGLAETTGTALRYLGGKLDSEGMTGLGETVEDYWSRFNKRYEADRRLQGSVVDNPKLLANGAWWMYNVASFVPSLGAALVPGIGAGRYIQAGARVLKATPEVAAKLARIGGAITGGVAGGTLEGAQTYQEVYGRVLEQGGTRDDAAAAAETGMEAMTALSGALNALGIERFLRALPHTAKGRLAARAARGFTEAVTEWLEGPVEAGIMMAGEHMTLDEAVQKTIDELNVAGPAFVVGFFMPGAGSLPTVEQGAQEAPPAAPADTGTRSGPRPEPPRYEGGVDYTPPESQPAPAARPGPATVEGTVDYIPPPAEPLTTSAGAAPERGGARAVPGASDGIPYAPPAIDEFTLETDVEAERRLETRARLNDQNARLGNVTLPPGLEDETRLKRDQFRQALRAMADELVPGGGIALVGGEFSDQSNVPRDQEQGIKRLPSVNPPWFQGQMDDKDFKMSVAQVRNAVTKALAGDRLGVRQARLVRMMLDETSDRRGREVDARREELAAARAERKALRDGFAPLATYDPDAEAAGDVYPGDWYGPEWDAPTRALAEIAQQALDIDPAGAERILEDRSITDAQAARALMRILMEADSGRLAPDDVGPGESVPAGGPAPAAPGAEAGGFTLTAPEATPEDTPSEPVAPETDLFGAFPATAQALADLENARAEAEANAPPIDAGEAPLFTEQGQADVFDQPAEKPRPAPAAESPTLEGLYTPPLPVVETEGPETLVRRFASGSTRPGDFRATLAAGGMVGIDIGELSETMEAALIEAVAEDENAPEVFIDSGAFKVFRLNESLKQSDQIDLSGFDPQRSAVDFASVLAAMQRIADEVDSRRIGASGGLHLVMPDVIGDPGASLALLEAHREAVDGLADTMAHLIFPVHGARPAAHLREIMKHVPQGTVVVVGIPSNVEALTDEQLRKLAETAFDLNIRRFHVLGAARGKRFNDRLETIRQVATERPHPVDELEVSGDANLIRSKIERLAGLRGAARETEVKRIIEEVAQLQVLRPPDAEDIDTAANEAATSPTNDRPAPSEAQIEAGNYKLGHITVGNLKISIENPKGSIRRGTDSTGKAWAVELQHHYGYILGTKGRDKDHIDVFVGERPNRAGAMVYVVNQVKPDGSFDEHKVLLGFRGKPEAREAYFSNYAPEFRARQAEQGPVVAFTMAEFEEWLAKADTTKPARAPTSPKMHPTLPPPGNPYQRGTESYALWQGLHSFTNAAVRWAERRRVGLTDEQLKAAIADEFGIGGGSLEQQHWGGKNPRMEWKDDEGEIHKLGGKKLLEAVRALMGIEGPVSGLPPDERPEPSASEAPGETIGPAPIPGPGPETPESADDELEPFEPIADADVPEFLATLLPGQSFESIVDARRVIAQITGKPVKAGTPRAKWADEAIELGVLIAARRIVAEGKPQTATFNALLNLYENQPHLGVRTSTSVAQQAYSTPVPIAYLAAVLSHTDARHTVYEPTAGNGALLITAAPHNVEANELNATRADTLERFGFKTVTRADATRHEPSQRVERVLANPPFGKVLDEYGNNRQFFPDPSNDGYRTEEVDHAIALKALESLKDDGEAVLLIAGPNPRGADETREKAYSGKARREFFLTLYGQYKVVDHFTLAGDLYRRQGAAWPIDVIVIHGRGKSTRALPAVEVPPVIASYVELRGKVRDYPSVSPARDEPALRPRSGGRGSARPEGGDLVAVPGSADRPGGGAAGGVPGGGRGGQGAGGARDEPGGAADLPGVPARPGDVVLRPPSAPRSGAADTSPPGDGGGRGGRALEGAIEPTGPAPPRGGPAGDVAGEDAGSTGRPSELETQRDYQPRSRGESLGTLVPVNMGDALARALERVAADPRGIDGFVAETLEYSLDELHEHFMAEQIDAIALALVNFETGAGFILGDQTGVGKGRVVAAMIRYAIQQGKVPIFVTEKPTLYADMYRDLTDIGMPELRILPTNASLSLPLTPEKKGPRLRTPGAKTWNQKLGELQAAGGLGEYDVIFTTYSQMQTLKGKTTPRMEFLRHFAADNLVIMDESHNAGGTEGMEAPGQQRRGKPKGGGRSRFARDLATIAWNVLFSSATYAKRPQVMDLYARTDMGLAVDKPADLGLAIGAGGVPLQQVVASMLSDAGQYVRRERSFEGVSYAVEPAPVPRELYESFSASLAAIYHFSEEYMKPAVGLVKKNMRAEGNVALPDGSVGKTGVESTNFASVMHNLINQMLLSISTPVAIERAAELVAADGQVVLTVANTMGSFLADEMKAHDLKVGDPFDATFANLLERYLQRSRRITISPPFDGPKIYHVLTDEELGAAGVDFYEATLADIREAAFATLSASPLDAILRELEARGLRTGEITGRNRILRRDAEGAWIIATRPDSTSARRGSINRFNEGKTDVLLINQAGSTGISLHSSVKNPPRGRRKRTMVIVQAEANIDTHMQLLGRVHRTGQVVAPAYVQLVADIPAARRPAAVLAKKMASLNANTTASRKSLVTGEALDFINQYGDEVIASILEDDRDLRIRLGDPLKSNQAGKLERDGAANKVSGRIPLLRLEEQEHLYDRIEADYLELIERMNRLGQNALEAATEDLRAETLEATPLLESKFPNSDSPFATGATLEKVRIRKLGAPHPPKKVLADIAKQLGAPAPDASLPLADQHAALAKAGGAWASAELAAVLEEFDAYRDAYLATLKEPDALRDNTARLRELRTSMDRLLAVLQPGKSVSVTTSEGERVFGVVVGVRRIGGARNPLARSSWRTTIYLASNMTQVTVPFSQVNNPETSGAAIDVTAQKFGRTEAGELVPIIDLFDVPVGGTVKTEVRYLATGNLLAAFAKLGGSGRILNFTRADREVHSGILLPRAFDPAEDLEPDTTVEVAEARTVVQYAHEGRHVTTRDGLVALERRGDGTVRLLIDGSRNRGGRYYTHPSLLAATGADLVRVGPRMRIDLALGPAEEAVRALQALEAVFLTDPEADGARADESGDNRVYEQEVEYHLPAARGGSVRGGRGAGLADLYTARAVQSPVEVYHQPDLFEQGAAERRSDTPEPPGRRRLVQTHARVVAVREGTFQHGLEHVRTAEDAAHMVAPLRKRAQEQFMVLVLDAAQRPLAIVRHTQGTRTSSIVDTGLVGGEIMRIEGAAEVWFAHNHPGGNPSQSSADRAVTARLTEQLLDTGIHTRGMIVTAFNSTQMTHYDPVHRTEETIEPTRARRASALPVLGRTLRLMPGALEEPADHPRLLKAAMPRLSGGKTGVAVFDTALRPLGWVDMPAEEMRKLRTGDTATGAALLLELVGKSNAGAIAVHFAERHPANQAAADNLGAFANAFDLRFVDVIEQNRSWRSAKQPGGQVPELYSAGPYYSKPPVFRSKLRQVVAEKLPKKGTVRAFIEAIRAYERKGLFRAEELRWSGLIPWLESLPPDAPAHRVGVVRFLTAHNLVVREAEPPEGPMYQTHTLPGGEGYRELALIAEGMSPDQAPYKNPHFYPDNTVAHVRFKTRRLSSPGAERDMATREKLARTRELALRALGDFETGMRHRYPALRDARYGGAFDEAIAGAIGATWAETETYLKLVTAARDAVLAEHTENPAVLFIEEIQSDWHRDRRQDETERALDEVTYAELHDQLLAASNAISDYEQALAERYPDAPEAESLDPEEFMTRFPSTPAEVTEYNRLQNAVFGAHAKLERKDARANQLRTEARDRVSSVLVALRDELWERRPPTSGQRDPTFTAEDVLAIATDLRERLSPDNHATAQVLDVVIEQQADTREALAKGARYNVHWAEWSDPVEEIADQLLAGPALMNAIAAERPEVPEAPFKQIWPTLAVKRMIRWAVDAGQEYVAWTSGAQQSARYSGTEPLKTLYDRVLPTQIGKYLRPWGIEIQQLSLTEPSGQPVWGFRITPELAAAARQGQPLFATPAQVKAGELPGRPRARGGVPVDSLEALVARVSRGWRNGPAVHVVADVPSLPPGLRDQVGHEQPEGLYDPASGAIYLVAGNLATHARAERVLAHEAIGHFGMERLLGEGFADLLDQVQALKRSGDPRTVALAAEVLERQGALSPHREAAEIIALMAENGVRNGVMARVAAAVRAALRRLGFTVRLSHADLAAMIARAARSLAGRPPGTPARVGGPGTEALFSKRALGALSAALRTAPKAGEWLEETFAYVGDKATDWRPGLLALLTRRQLGDIGAKLLPEIQGYVREAQQLDADRNNLITEAGAVASRWGKWAARNAAAADALAELMHESTVRGVDPSKDYTPVIDVTKVDEKIRKLREQARGRPGEGTAKFERRMEKLRMQARQEAARKRAYGPLLEQWNALTPEAKAFYEEVRDFYMRRFQQTHQAIEDRINRANVSGNEKIVLKGRLRRHFEAARVQAPYFPLARFGDFWVVTKDDGGRTVAFDMFPSAREQRQFSKAQRLAGRNVEVGKRLQNLSSVHGASESFVADIAAILDKIGGGEAERVKDQVYQLYLATLPDLSVRKHFIHRKKRAGYSRDALRAFADNQFHTAYQLSRLRHMDVLQTALDSMRQMVPKTEDPNRAADIYQEMSKRHEWIQSPMTAPWTNAATSIGFAWYLGITPAAAIVNLTQTPLVAYPFMAAKFGWAKSGSALQQSMRDFMAGGLGVEGSAKVRTERGGLTWRAYQQLLDEGVLEKTMAADLAGRSETPSAIYGGLGHKVMGAMSFMFHHAERFNREVTAIAAYRLAMDAGLMHHASVDYARDVVFETHFDYASSNRARIMQGNFARVALMFRSYSQHITYLLARSAQLTFRGETPEVRRLARRKLTGILGLYAMAAGVTGLPLWSAVATILGALFDDDDDPYDFEVEFWNFLADYIGTDAAHVVMKGAPQGLAGLGISSRISLNELWFRDPGRELEASATVDYWIMTLLGPGIEIFRNFGRGMGYIEEGNLERGMELMLPKALKDVARGVRYGAEGVTTLKGDPVLEDVNAWQLLQQTVGFTPGEISLRYEANRAIKNAEARLLNRRRLLLNRYALARRTGDRDLLAEVREAIAAFNAANPAFPISTSTLRKSTRGRKRASNEMFDGIRLASKRLAYLREAGRFAE